MNSLAMKALWRQSAPQSRQKSFYFLSRRVSPSNPSSLSRFFSASPTVPSADPSFFSKYKKYFMISSPALLALLFHAGLFNSTQFRYFIESNFLPDYVDYLRQQYGYDDEDPVERARIASINQQIAQSEFYPLFLPFPHHPQKSRFASPSVMAPSLASKMLAEISASSTSSMDYLQRSEWSLLTSRIPRLTLGTLPPPPHTPSTPRT
jgi:hypothetical protein